MRLIGYSFHDAEGPVSSGWLPIGDLSVILGANDTGKSRLLRQIEDDLVGRRKAPGGDSAFFVELEENEFQELLAMTLYEKDGWSDVTANVNPEAERLAYGLTPSEFVGDGGPAWQKEIRARHGSRSGSRAALRLLSGSRVLAVSGAERDRALHWCGPSLAGLSPKQAAAVRAFTSEDEGSRGFSPDAPTPIAPVGSFAGPLLPAPVRLPMGDERVCAEVADAISQWLGAFGLLAVVVAGQGNDYATVIATRIEQWGVLECLEAAGLDPSQLWLDRTDERVPQIAQHARQAFAALVSAAQDARAPLLAARYDLTIEPAPLWEWGSGSKVLIRLRPYADPSATDHGGRLSFPLAEVADGLRLWVELAVLEAVDTLRIMTGHLLHAIGLVAEEVTATGEPHPISALFKDLVGDLSPDTLLDGLRARGFVAPFRFIDAIGPGQGFLERPNLREAPSLYATLAWWDAQAWGYTRRSVSSAMLRAARPTVYLIDEPERHLNPRLVRETAQWLERRLREHRSQAIIVTHAVGFLGAQEARFTHVSRTARSGRLRPFEASELVELQEVCGDLGFDRGELLGLARLLLFVEGETDRVVLNTLFGRRLWPAIVVVSISGTQNHSAVTEAGVLLRYCDLPAAVAFDALDADLVHRLRADPAFRRKALGSKHNETKAMARLLDQAEENHRPVRPLPLAALDMFDLLDDEVLADRFPGFPGHAAVNQEWGLTRPRTGQFWAGLRDRCGIEKRVTVFRDVAEEMRARGRVPVELEALVSQAEAIASEW